MEIKTYEELKSIYEAMTPEERKAKRKARREAKKNNASKQSSINSDDDIYDMDEIDAKQSKSMTQSVERFRKEQIKLQN